MSEAATVDPHLQHEPAVEPLRVATYARQHGEARDVAVPGRRRDDLWRGDRRLRRLADRQHELADSLDHPRYSVDRGDDLRADLQQPHDGRGVVRNQAR